MKIINAGLLFGATACLGLTAYAVNDLVNIEQRVDSEEAAIAADYLSDNEAIQRDISNGYLEAGVDLAISTGTDLFCVSELQDFSSPLTLDRLARGYCDLPLVELETIRAERAEDIREIVRLEKYAVGDEAHKRHERLSHMAGVIISDAENETFLQDFFDRSQYDDDRTGAYAVFFDQDEGLKEYRRQEDKGRPHGILLLLAASSLVSGAIALTDERMNRRTVTATEQLQA